MAGVLRQFDPDKVSVSWAIKGGATLDLTEGLIDGPTAIVEADRGGRALILADAIRSVGDPSTVGLI